MYSSPKDLHMKQLTEFGGHKDEVNCVSFSSDFSIMVTGSDDKRVRVFDVRTKRCILSLGGHRGAVKCVAISPCDRYFASGSFDKNARIWKTDEGSCLRILPGHKKSVEAVTFSSCSVYLCTGSWDRTAILWCVQTGCQIRTFDGHGSLVQSVAFSPIHKLVASGSWDFSVRVWTLDHIENMRIVDAFLKKRKSFMHGEIDEDDTVKEDMAGDVTNVPQDECKNPKDNGGIIETDNGQTAMENKSSDSKESDKCVARGIYVDYKKACQKEDKLRNIDKLDDTLEKYTISEEDAMRNKQSHESKSKVMNEEDEHEQAKTKGTDKRELLKCESDGNDTDSCTILTGHTGNIHAVAFSQYGMLASGSWDRSVRIWNPLKGNCIHILLGHTGWVQAVSFSPDGGYCASAADDECVKVWDVVIGQCVNTLEGCTYLAHHCAFTPDGHVIAAGASSPPADMQTERERAQLAERQIKAILDL
ncbi:unnamed protein product [Candidula unifasciata]|uniref:Uncharacterized protein n=1 Tax=Candidula unifasciata TaxID=100452 RepID=A0A8S3YJ24_9EUPU|nr:unnamed protein product [Candidula unifasciata]